jgi:hypothetical protein
VDRVSLHPRRQLPSAAGQTRRLQITLMPNRVQETHSIRQNRMTGLSRSASLVWLAPGGCGRSAAGAWRSAADSGPLSSGRHAAAPSRGTDPHPSRRECGDDLAERCCAIWEPCLRRRGGCGPACLGVGSYSRPRAAQVATPTRSCCPHGKEWWGQLGLRTLGGTPNRRAQ